MGLRAWVVARLSVVTVSALLSSMVAASLVARCVGADVPCSPAALLLTRDQLGQRYYDHHSYAHAADVFVDLDWRATALYRAGELERAAGIWKGMPTAEAAFNRGNALVLRGEYDEAVEAYGRALTLRPDWAAAKANRDLAQQRAQWLEKTGAEMTGGQLGADEIVFGDSKPPAGQVPDEPAEGQGSDADQRAIWLRQVDTKPGDFLRARFAYEAARASAE